MFLRLKLLWVVLQVGNAFGNSVVSPDLESNRWKSLADRLFPKHHWNIKSSHLFEEITSRTNQPSSGSTGSFRVLCSNSLEEGKTLGKGFDFHI